MIMAGMFLFYLNCSSEKVSGILLIASSISFWIAEIEFWVGNFLNNLLKLSLRYWTANVTLILISLRFETRVTKLFQFNLISLKV